MNKRPKIAAKYGCFNIRTYELYLCNSKVDVAKCCNVSTRTILRKSLIANTFIVNEWVINSNVEVHKQPVRNILYKL